MRVSLSCCSRARIMMIHNIMARLELPVHATSTGGCSGSVVHVWWCVCAIPHVPFGLKRQRFSACYRLCLAASAGLRARFCRFYRPLATASAAAASRLFLSMYSSLTGLLLRGSVACRSSKLDACAHRPGHIRLPTSAAPTPRMLKAEWERSIESNQHSNGRTASPSARKAASSATSQSTRSLPIASTANSPP